MIKLTRRGIMFSYHGDVLTLAWFWNNADQRYRSEAYKKDFHSLADYWKNVGILQETCSRQSSKVSGFSLEEIIQTWVRVTFPGGDIVVMYDMDVSKKPTDFWRSVPILKAKEMVQDVVAFQCKDAGQAIDLCDSTDPTFAKAIRFHQGYRMSSNEEYYIDH